MDSRCAALAALLMISGCWTPPRALVKVSSPDPGVLVSGLSSCHPEADGVVTLDPARPLIVLVHGCSFSRGGFRTLASVFEAHGQQTVCFNYDDRDRLENASAQLIVALESLSERLPGRDLTVVGHSQGGLVARRAVVRDRARPLQLRPGTRLRLVTISSPFAGIASSADCGKTWLHVLTLGITVGVCQGIAGAKWQEIYPNSEFMRHPGTLLPEVEAHVKVVTDERGACRRYGSDGRCAESDAVFTLDEQYAAAVDQDGRTANVEVKAGHIEIVGERGTPPTKLLEVLEARQILAETSPDRRQEMAALLDRLY